MTGVVVAFAASLPLGVALGVIGAACARGSIRPCGRLRRHRRAAVASGGVLALAGAVTIAVASANVDHERASLTVTCGAIVLLIGVALWVLLVEADDGDAGPPDDGPEWWPTFERELEEWARKSPVLSR